MSVAFRVRLYLSPSSVWDVTDDVLSISISRTVADTWRSLSVGGCDILLDNALSRYSPSVSSYHNGLLIPNVEVAIEAVTEQSSGLFVLDESRLDTAILLDPTRIFTGFIDSITARPGLGEPREVMIGCSDRMKEFSRRVIETRLLRNTTVASLFSEMLDVASISTLARSIAPIEDELGFAWFNNARLLPAVNEVLTLGGYTAYVNGGGIFTVQDRFYDLGGPVVASYADIKALGLTLDDTQIINSVRVRGSPREIVDSVQVIAELTEALAIPASGAVGFFLDYQDPRNQEAAPATEVVTPVSATDYLLNSESTGSGTDYTGQASVAVSLLAETAVSTIFNGTGAEVFLTRYRLRGKPISRRATVTVERVDEASQAQYGIEQLVLESRLLGSKVLIERRADDIISLRADPAWQVAAGVINDWPTTLELDLGDKIHLSNAFLDIDEQFTIKGITHVIDAVSQGWVHRADYQLEQARTREVFVLNSPTRGVLDTNRLGREGGMGETVSIIHESRHTDEVKVE